ncbi:MAG: SIS domain-containing protein [Actinomycetota bacterium]
MGFDQAVLDDAELLASRDDGRMLWALATAGAQVRRSVSATADAGFDRLGGNDVPRAVLVCTDAAAVGVTRLLVRLSTSAAPIVGWHGADLPRWAGPADAVLIGSTDGRQPRQVRLVEQAAHRGLAMAVVAPAGTPLAEAAGRAPVVELPADLHVRAARWSMLTPLLLAGGALGVLTAPPDVLAAVADALDETAESCRPQSDAFTNAAKALAIEVTDSLPVVAGAGALASVAAALISDALQLLAGVPAVAVALPDGVARAGALLRGSPTDFLDDEFFRDRDLESTVLRARLITVGDDGDPQDPVLGPKSDAELALDELAARRAASVLRGIATQLGLRSSVIEVPTGPPLARFAAATAFGDFTAAYVALGRGIDPSEPRPGELGP